MENQTRKNNIGKMARIENFRSWLAEFQANLAKRKWHHYYTKKENGK